MKRIFSLVAVGIIAFLLISDIGLLQKYMRYPDAYAAMRHVSFLHYLLLHERGIQFALFKLITSSLLLVSWLRTVVRPAKGLLLGAFTAAYALLWAFTGLLVLTGIVGILQHSVGMPIRYFDFTFLVSGMKAGNLAFLLASTVLLPLALMLLPVFNSRVQSER